MSRYSLLVDLLENVDPGASIIDCGCGYGKGLPAILKLAPGFLVAADVDVTQLAVTKFSLVRSHSPGGKKVIYVWADIRKLPFVKLFDYFFCCETLEHLKQEDNEGTVTSIARSMKEDGKLCLSLPGADYIRNPEHLQFLPDKAVKELFGTKFDFIRQSIYRKYETGEKCRMFSNLMIFRKR